MEAPAYPANEAQRVATLKHMGLLDVPPLERFERITRLARGLFKVPYALITLVDSERQWFLSRGGGWQVEQTPRDVSFCGHTILSGEPMVVLDSLADPRFRDNPLVTGPPHIRFYAGQALRAADGTRFGTLCMIDRKPWEAFSEAQYGQLRDLAAIAEQEFWLTQASQSLRGGDGDLGEVLRETVTITGHSAINPIEYERARQRIATLYEVCRLLVDPLSPIAAIGEAVLKVVGEAEAWTYGGIWTIEGAALSLTAAWHDSSCDVSAFAEVSRRSRFTEGVGLLGRVFDRREPVWVADVLTTPGFTRAEAAEQTGFNCGVFVPLRGKDGAMLGAMEYFTGETCHPDDGRLKLLSVLGVQLGRFLEVRDALNEQVRLVAREAEIRKQLAAAHEVDRLKTELANAVSHELRTPLTTITGYAELLEDSVEGNQTAVNVDYIRQIRHAIVRLDRLVADMLDDARIEAGTFRLEPAAFDLGETARSVAESLRPMAAAAHVDLRVEAGGPELSLVADGGRLEQVLTNFTTNAIKFTPPGGRVTLSCAREGESVRCAVCDTGAGIAEADLPKLFTRFAQVGEGRQKKGMGLGLSIAKAIIEEHGGAIGVESHAGSGSTFWFTLPVAPRGV